MKYQIENTISGVVLGTYEAATPREALDAMARDAGYEDYGAACEVAPAAEGEIAVRAVGAPENHLKNLTIRSPL